jgi:hypothetical protein
MKTPGRRLKASQFIQITIQYQGRIPVNLKGYEHRTSNVQRPTSNFEFGIETIGRNNSFQNATDCNQSIATCNSICDGIRMQFISIYLNIFGNYLITINGTDFVSNKLNAIPFWRTFLTVLTEFSILLSGVLILEHNKGGLTCMNL